LSEQDFEETYNSSKFIEETVWTWCSEDATVSWSSDEVLLLRMTKGHVRSTTFPVDTRLGEVAEWLNEGYVPVFPIQEYSSSRSLPKDRSSISFRKRTIANVFGDRLNPKNHGISFFLGPVEGKLCFKMILSDLATLKLVMKTRLSESKSIDISASWR